MQGVQLLCRARVVGVEAVAHCSKAWGVAAGPVRSMARVEVEAAEAVPQRELEH